MLATWRCSAICDSSSTFERKGCNLNVVIYRSSSGQTSDITLIHSKHMTIRGFHLSFSTNSWILVHFTDIQRQGEAPKQWLSSCYVIFFDISMLLPSFAQQKAFEKGDPHSYKPKGFRNSTGLSDHENVLLHPSVKLLRVAREEGGGE